MKTTKIYVMLLALIVCVSCSEDEQIENLNQDAQSALSFEQISDFIIERGNQTSKNSLNKGESNGNGVYFVPFISNSRTEWMLFWDLPDSNLFMVLEYPQDGEDRLLIFNEEEMMINWTVEGPRIFITDYDDGIVKYSNWCDENKTGFYHINGKSTYNPIDINGDGEIDIYGWNPGTLGKNFNMKVKTTMTDSQITGSWEWPVQGNCKEATEEVEFNYVGKLSNGKYTQSATFK